MLRLATICQIYYNLITKIRLQPYGSEGTKTASERLEWRMLSTCKSELSQPQRACDCLRAQVYIIHLAYDRTFNHAT